MNRADFVRSFQIEGMNVRGRVTRLTDVADKIVAQHNYPDAVSKLTGEALGLVSLLGASLKFDGTLTVQTRSDGPVRMLVADYTSPGILRACATFDADAVAALGTAPDFETLVGQGSLAITIDPGGDMERYQGIVPLEGAGLEDAAVRYFEISEQLPTRIRLSVATLTTRGQDPRPRWRVGGMMIQNLAELGGTQTAVPVEEGEEHWARAAALFSTIEAYELVDPDVDPERLLFRLFHEDGVRVFDVQPASFGCRCDAQRLETVLRQYSQSQLAEFANEAGMISAKCEFCSTEYQFALRAFQAES